MIKEVIKWYYENCLYEKLKLELYDVKDCSNMLHDMCQNNIDHTKFDGGFEEKNGLAFCCLGCMSKCIISENKIWKKSKPSNKVSDIIEIEDEEKSQDKNLEGLFDKSDSSDSGSVIDVDSNDDLIGQIMIVQVMILMMIMD